MSDLDWSTLSLPHVSDIVDQAARRVANKYHRYVEYADLKQEASILVCSRADLLECVGNEDLLGRLQYRLEMDLVNIAQSVVTRQDRSISYEETIEASEAGEGSYLPYVSVATISEDYTRESVESLLPAVWDESYLYGLPVKDSAPDPDMPKGSTNKARGNSLAAYIADIKTGWAKTPLTLKERRALLLYFGFGWDMVQIGYNQNVSKQTIHRRIETAVGKIVRRLNGGFWSELDAVEA